MTVTAKLAYSQLKVTRSRTAWTLAAIALSTALTTAVSSFAAAGSAMLLGLLGPGYGEYGGSYVGLLLIPAVFLGIIILLMSVVVVSNVFRVSAGERQRQFGMLKCVGATARQISETVMYESLFLSAVGIPLGILAGLGLTLAGINVANIYLAGLNALAHIMINDIQLKLGFVFSWQAVLCSALCCFASVLVSAWLPAREAAKASAVDSVRGSGAVAAGRADVRVSPLAQKLFGVEGALAARNMRRSRKSFRATTAALASGVVLFISLGALGAQARAIEDLMLPKLEQTVIVEYSSACARDINKITGREESTYLRPIDSSIGEALVKKLEAFDGKSVFGMGGDLETYHTILPSRCITPQMSAALGSSGQKNCELAVEIITLDRDSYRALCQKAGVPEGSTVLLDHYSYNDNGKEVHLVPFSSLEAVELIKADGSRSTVEVQGALTQADIPGELFYINTNPVRLVVERAQVRSYACYASPADEPGFIAYADRVMAEAFPESGSSYMEEGFNTRVYMLDDYAKVMNIAIVLAAIFMYSFVALLMLIGLTNVVSTLTANVRMRAREFAVLQSVGMTPRGLGRMLALESLLCALRAVAVGLPVGLVFTYLINRPIRAMFPIPYEPPLAAALLCALVVSLVTWGVTACAARGLRRQNLIETIRSESGR